MKIAAIVVLLVMFSSSAYGFQMKAMQMREDYGAEPLYDCYMNYYYTIPCPTTSWFWAYSGPTWGDIIGVCFTVGDLSMSATGCPPYSTCDPLNDCTIEQFRVLDFAGYGTMYPGIGTISFDIWCGDQNGCPVEPSLWSSGPMELCTEGWNYITVSPSVCLTQCHTQPGPPYSYPRFVITATSTAYSGYPFWGFDNISTPLEKACVMHDVGCCPALYPRPHVSNYNTIHSGYYGNVYGYRYCPPVWFLDGNDTTRAGTIYGFIELAWRIYLSRTGPTAVEPSTWGNIKSMYR